MTTGPKPYWREANEIAERNIMTAIRCPKCGSTNCLTERRPNGNSRCLDCQLQGPTKLFDGQTAERNAMKKKVELKAFVEYNGTDNWFIRREYHEGNVPCTITFEVDVPEPTATVTPSMIDEISEEWGQKLLSHEEYKRGFIPFFKQKLFGRPSEG